MNKTISVWDEVMAKRRNDDMHKGVANTLSDDDIRTIAATIDFFGGDYRQDVFDLRTIRYRVFDWLAMRVQGRRQPTEHDTVATKVLVHAFLKVDGVPSKFIQDLRETDYEVDTSWEDKQV